jgi:hypothetical protein
MGATDRRHGFGDAIEKRFAGKDMNGIFPDVVCASLHRLLGIG